MAKIRYYISGHGLGHASRSCQVINALHSYGPSLKLDIVSDAAPWFFKDNLPASLSVRRAQLDVGIVQTDSLQMRLDQTLLECLALLKQSPALIESEAHLLIQDRVDLVVTDVAALPCLAARKAGCLSVILSNFTWDWIYEAFLSEYRVFQEIVDWHCHAYAAADLALRLPFHGPLNHPTRRIDLPLIARKGTIAADNVRNHIGLGNDQFLGLLSFGGFGLRGLDLRALESLSEWIFLAEPEFSGGAQNLRALPQPFGYPDLVKAADAVVTKPGYGIVAECIANQTAVLFTSRGNFREQKPLIEGLLRFTRAEEVTNSEFYRGMWHEPLQKLLQQQIPKEHLELNGAEVAAKHLIALLS